MSTTNAMEMNASNAMEMSTTGERMGNSVLLEGGGHWHSADNIMSMRGQVAATSALSRGV